MEEAFKMATEIADKLQVTESFYRRDQQGCIPVDIHEVKASKAEVNEVGKGK